MNSITIGKYSFNYISDAILDKRAELTELPSGSYETKNGLCSTVIKDLSNGAKLGCDKYGNMVLYLSEDIPCFDSGDFMYGSYEALYIINNEGEIFALYRRGGYYLSKQVLINTVTPGDERTTALFDEAKNEWERYISDKQGESEIQ